jgi:hypothetical protein
MTTALWILLYYVVSRVLLVAYATGMNRARIGRAWPSTPEEEKIGHTPGFVLSLFLPLWGDVILLYSIGAFLGLAVAWAVRRLSPAPKMEK